VKKKLSPLSLLAAFLTVYCSHMGKKSSMYGLSNCDIELEQNFQHSVKQYDMKQK
jgi:hypothetical protein